MRRLRRAAAVFLGVLVGLALIEGAFRLRDHGAFPHLNIYRSDVERGVRLQQHATEKISFSDNPVSFVRTNSEAYRGAEWGAPQENAILIVGDSQAFGLGVDEGDAFAWKLGALTHRPILNAAVPTYGPDEYNAVLAEQLSRRPKTVVYVVNLANDLFEASHPNKTRHVVWDGWAVRKETAPRGIHDFPGRQFLFTESHAFFALRGLWFKWSGASDDVGVPSEGTWRDLLDAKQAAETAPPSPDAASAKLKQLGDDLDTAMQRAGVRGRGTAVLRTARANAGDIVLRYVGEGSREVSITAGEILMAASERSRFEEALRVRHDYSGLSRLSEYDRMVKTRGTRPLETPPTPIFAHLAKAKQLCDQNGAELILLVLPLDVQVADAEWAKYPGSHKVDLSSTRILAWEVLAAAEALGARAVDAWPVLTAAEPGAFLKGDLHMSPKGHAAVAAALARVLARPRVAGTLPSDRSAIPSPAEWALARSIGISGGEPSLYLPYGVGMPQLGCVYKRVREWLSVGCRGGGFKLEAPTTADALIVNSDGYGRLIAAVTEGKRLIVDFTGDKVAMRIRFDWPLDSTPTSSFSGLDTYGLEKRAFQPTAADAALCSCEKRVTGAAECSALYGAAEPGCTRAYGDDCESLLECARGDSQAPPRCLPNEKVNAVTGRCVASAKP